MVLESEIADVRVLWLYGVHDSAAKESQLLGMSENFGIRKIGRWLYVL